MFITPGDKVYAGNAGVEIRLDTGIDCSGYTTKKIIVLKPDLSTVEWVATAVDGNADYGELELTKNVLRYVTVSGDQTAAGIYKMQPHVENSVDDKHDGDTFEMEVFALNE